MAISQEQIVALLDEHAAGAEAADICYRHGISGAEFYAWKATLGGKNISETTPSNPLLDENLILKRLLAEAMLEIAVLKERISKSLVTLAVGRKAAEGHAGPHSSDRSQS